MHDSLCTSFLCQPVLEHVRMEVLLMKEPARVAVQVASVEVTVKVSATTVWNTHVQKV